ncbi:MAG: hypothetical protein KDA65_01155 [Planctomycetaceae bacterium]|nr:hypothetical protein [Planctomycetaceae bacterium]
MTLVLYNKTEIQGRYLAMIFGNVCPAALFLVSIDGASSGERAIGVSYAVSPLPAISFPLIAATLSLWATRWFLKMGNPDMSTTDESQRTGPENEN